MSRVAVVYPYVPHYRRPVFSALAHRGGTHRYVFFAGSNLIEGSIRSVTTDDAFEIRQAPIRHKFGLTFQSGLARAVLGSEFDVLVFLGNPYFASTWIYALAARLRGKKVWFWTHGWLARESGVKGLVRNLFYRLADGLLLYGEHARKIGLDIGFAASRLQVVYNSLDYDAEAAVRRRLEEAGPSASSQRLPMALQGRSTYIACIARLTAKCRFDLAIDAIALINATRPGPLSLVLIGDGPERENLARLGRERAVDVVFLGEMYDEELIGTVLFNARVVVSPGKVGLTAMHSLAYGTPVITHGCFEEQMPEFEAVRPGVTGDFFRQDDAVDLARVIGIWLDRPRTAAERLACVNIIESCYTPRRQVELIEAALQGGGRS